MPYDTLMAAYGANFAASSGLLTATGAATTFDTTAAITYAINGKAYVKATIAGGVTPVNDGNTGVAHKGLVASKTSVWVLALDAALAVAAFQGSIETLGVAPQFPMLPNTHTAFAYIIVNAGSTTVGTWTFGASNWNATGITRSIQNVLVLPCKPQAS